MDPKLLRVLSEIQYASQDLNTENIGDAFFPALKTGRYYDRRYGEFIVDMRLLKELKKNFDDNVLDIGVALDKSHMSYDGAYAWLAELKIKGNVLYAQYKDFTEEGTDALTSKRFKYFSIEFGPFEKPSKKKGKLDKFANVLRGIAMTNRPVVKGMKDKPSFFSQSIYSSLFTNPQNMKMFKTILEKLKGKDEVSLAETELLDTAFAELSDEEQTEFAAEVDKVKEKAKKEEEEKKKKEEEKKKKVEGKDKKKSEGKGSELSEIVEKQGKELSEARATIAIHEGERDERVLSERMGEVMISKTNTTGFAVGVKDDVEKLLKSFSAEQWADFQKAMKAWTTPDLTVRGSEENDIEDSAVLAEFNKAVDKHQKENPEMKYADSMIAIRDSEPKFKNLV